LEQHLAKRSDRLATILKGYGTLAVAFSGGVDSTLLLDVAHEALGPACLAVTARSASFPERERAAAAAFCRERGIEQIEIESEELDIEGFSHNPPNRCYLCKKELFSKMLALAHTRGIATIAEGSNLDDEDDYRPGLVAITELGIKSPLREAGLTKADVRALAQARALAVWDKPSFACLASRLPYGAQIDRDVLARIDQAETFLLETGLRQVRVRVHGDIARIETDAEGMDRLAEPQVRAAVVERLQTLGFPYVTLDLRGYRTGSMSLTLPR
jgi:uncharacterized protein